MISDNSFLKIFYNVYEQDRAYVARNPSRWKYQDVRTKYKSRYPEDVVNDFNNYDGPEELLKWFNWLKQQKNPTFFSSDEIEPLVDKLTQCDMAILKKYNLNYLESDYRNSIGINSAMDYLFQNAYKMPERYDIRNVLDFGAGFGRQANLWTQLHEDILFVGVDAIPKSYCLQNFYYNNLNRPVYEYMSNPANFQIKDSMRGIYHLPTWRVDLLPNNFFDMIICTQVLNELDKKSVMKLVQVFRRILKPGGKLYIRDHENHIMTDRRNMDKILSRNLFKLEFKPYLIDNQDVHGTVRIWRKIDNELENKNNVFKKRSFLMDLLYTKLGLYLYKAYKFLKK